MTVYGYLACWDDDLASLPWDELSHLAIFAAEATTAGGLEDTDRWDIAADAVAMAAPYGVEVHLVVLNFDTEELRTLLGDGQARSDLVAELADRKARTGAHGINVDFENLPGDRRDEMVDFVQDLEAAVGDVVLATPSVDGSAAWDYATLTDHADLFIMGYGYHWSGASYAGPMDPLHAGSGTVWEGVDSFSLSWSANDYLSAGAAPDRVILGLPLYGMRWPTASDAVPSSAQASGSAVVFSEAWSLASTHGQRYEPDSMSLHTHDGVDQIWFGDVSTVADRVIYARDVAGVGGVGFWAQHYDDDDPAMWAMLHDETTWSTSTPGTTDTGTAPPTDTGTAPTTDRDTDTPPTGTTDTDGSEPRPDAPSAQSVAPPSPEKAGCGCEGGRPASVSPFLARRRPRQLPSGQSRRAAATPRAARLSPTTTLPSTLAAAHP